jgi:predicted transcriptional regulator
MTFEEAVWNFERIYTQLHSEGDLDVELVVQCMISFEDSADKLNSNLARRLFEQLKIIEEEFEKQKISYKKKLHRIREGRHALYKYKNKNLKVDNRFLYRNI